MKKICLLGLALCSAFILSNNYNTENGVVAQAEDIKMVNPYEIDQGTPMWHTDGNLEYRWEYLLNKYPGTETIIKDIAYLEFNFYSDENFDSTKDYAKVNHYNQGVMQSSEIVSALKAKGYKSDEELKVAIRYVPKVEGYLASDYYIPSVSHTYSFTYEESFEEQRVESYYSERDLQNYLSGIKVDDSGRIWWAWEIFNNGGEDANPVDQLKFYVYDESDNYYGYFTQKLSDQFTYADDLENSLLSIAGVPAGEGTYKFKVQLIAKKGYAYSNSDIYDVDGSYNYNVVEYVEPVEPVVSIAKGKTVITPDYADGSNPSNIVDGDKGTAYRPHDGQDGPYVNDPWFAIDLGASYNLSEINTYFEAACPSKFEVYVTDTVITSNYAGDFSEFNKVGEREYEFVGGRNPVDSFTLKNTSGRFVIVNCLGAASGYGIQLFEVEVFEEKIEVVETENGVVSLYGTQFGKDSKGNTALRFIGQIKDVDLDTYESQIQIRVTYTCGEKTATGTLNVNTLYKSLTEKNGTESLPEVENSYYFYLLLTNIPFEGVSVSTYFVEVLVDGELVDNATYVYSIA